MKTLNWREIDALLTEFPTGGYLKRVRQSDFRGIFLEMSGLRKSWAVVIILTAPHARLHLCSQKLPKALPQPPRFTALLKSRLEGARLSSAVQLGADRVVRFTWERGSDVLFLDAKLWGDGANLILSNSDGRIIDVYYRRPNRKECPGLPWPPTGLGRGPLPPPDQYPLRPLPGSGTWNQQVETFFLRLEEEEKTHRLRTEWEAYLNRRENALNSREYALSLREQQLKDQIGDGHKADIIMAHLHAIPRGADVIEAEDWEDSGKKAVIPLRVDLSARENAERYYRRQKQAKRGLENLIDEKAVLRKRRTHLVDLRRQLLAGETRSPFLQNPPPDRSPRKGREGPPLPGLWVRRPPFLIVVGRNAGESDTLLRRWARGNDLWLHVRDWPGGHVFVRSPRGKSVPLDLLLDAGNLALAYSRGKRSGEADLHYTQVKNLRRVRGGAPGAILPSREKNIHICLDPKRLAALKAASD